MALPAFIGAGWLAGLFFSAVGGLIGWFSKYLTKRIAIAAAMVASLAALTAAFWVAIEGLLAGLSAVTPDYFSQAVGLVVPSNISTCFAVIASAHVLKWGFDMQAKILIATEGGAGK